MKLTIAFWGSSLVSSYWNGAATYYRGIIRAVAELGHTITFYEPDAFDRQKHRDMEDPSWARVKVYEPTEEAALAHLKEAAQADIVVKASGVGVLDEWLEQAVIEYCSHTTTIFWDVDAPATLARVDQNENDPFRQLIPEYDMILTYGGGDPVIDAYTKLGARYCQPIYNALDPTTHHPVEPDTRFSSALLGFLGNRLPDREARVKEYFLKPAQQLQDKRFLLGGSGWDDIAHTLPNLDYAGHIYTRDHNAFNSSPLAVLNINRDSMAATGFSPPTRVFEAAGAAACLIMDYWQGVEQFLEPDSEVLVARNGDEVAAHLQNLSVARAKRIGQAARERVLAEHTYRHRAEQFEQIMKTERINRAYA